MKPKLKTVSALLLSFALFSGCSYSENENDIVSASFYPMYLLAKEITKDTDINVKNIASPQTGCLHDYQLTTGNVRLLNESDVLIINGGGMEDTFIESASQNADVKIIDTSSHIESTSEEETNHDHHEHDHEEHDHGHEGHDHGENAHYWMDIHYAVMQAEEICHGLSEIYPEYSEVFQNNFNNFSAQCEDLEEKYDFYINETINAISFNEAFEFLCEHSNMNVVSSFEIDENFTPSARELAETIDTAANENVSLIVTADDAGKSYADLMSRELNVPVAVLDPMTYIHDDNTSYIELMSKNLETIKEVFENDKP